MLKRKTTTVEGALVQLRRQGVDIRPTLRRLAQCPRDHVDRILALPVKPSRARRWAGLTAYAWRPDSGIPRHKAPATCIKLAYAAIEQRAGKLADDAIVATFFHELAHAIVGHRVGHGPLWSTCAEELGGEAAAANGFTGTLERVTLARALKSGTLDAEE